MHKIFFNKLLNPIWRWLSCFRHPPTLSIQLWKIFPNSDVIPCRHDIPIHSSWLSNVGINCKHFSLGGNPPTYWGSKERGLSRKGAGWHTKAFQWYRVKTSHLWQDTADCRWAITSWTHDIEESLWLVQPGINHAMIIFFSPTSQTVSVLKKTLSYLIVLSTLQFCWLVNKKFQNYTINHSSPRAEESQPLLSLTWGGMKAFMVQKW